MASPRVAYLGTGGGGQGDIARALGYRETPSGLETLYLRSKVLLDVRTAGITNPIGGLWDHIHDLEGLRRTPSGSARSAIAASTPFTRATCRSSTRCSRRRQKRWPTGRGSWTPWRRASSGYRRGRLRGANGRHRPPHARPRHGRPRPRVRRRCGVVRRPWCAGDACRPLATGVSLSGPRSSASEGWGGPPRGGVAVQRIGSGARVGRARAAGGGRVRAGGAGGRRRGPPPQAPTTAAAGAPGAPPATIEALATYDGPDRQQILEAGARQEGKLTWYTSSIRETIGQPMMAAFQQKYPFLQVEYYRADGVELRQRAREETRAGRRVADIFETTHGRPCSSPRPTASFAVSLALGAGLSRGHDAAAGLLGRHAGALPGDRLQHQRDPPGGGAAELRGLAGPEMEGEDRPAQRRHPDPVRGADGGDAGRGTSWSSSAARTSGSREVSQTALANLIASGEVVLTPAMTSKDARSLQAKGAPIGWNPAKPMSPPAGRRGAGQDRAHPHAALLMIDFMLSRADGRGTGRVREADLRLARPR